MNNSREFILDVAFDQYLTHGYDGVSISVLQEAMKLGRATIYYHFANKEDLFKEVVNEYVVKILRPFTEKTDRTDLDLGQLIAAHTDLLEEIASTVRKASPERRLTSYLAIMLYAYTHDEEFHRFADDLRERLRSAWASAVRKCREEGTIGETTPETAADLFCGLDKFSGWERKAGKFVAQESPFIKNCHLLHQLIKNQ